MAADRSGRRTALALLAVALAFGAAWLVTKAIPHGELADFRAVWMAGRLWDLGLNPYGAAFDQLKPGYFPAEKPVSWLYPPHFWAIAAPFGALPRPFAALLWNGLNLALLAGGLVALWAAARRRGVAIAWLLLLALYLCGMTATGGALAVGQTGFWLFLGIGLVAGGLARQSAGLVAAGAAIVLLKPQFGIALLTALAAHPNTRRAAIGAVVLVAIASLPALAIGGPVDTVRNFVANATNYRTIAYNEPEAMTGVGHVAAVLAGVRLPNTLLLALAALIAPLLMWASREDRAALLIAPLASVALLVPLHIYDLLVIAPLPFLLALVGGATVRAGAVSGGLLLLRPENLARLANIAAPAVATAGAALLFAAALTYALQARASRPARA